MMTALAIGAVAAPIIGGIMGANAAQDERDAANEAYSKAFHQYDNLDIPDIEKQKLALKSPEVAGILQPYMEKNIEQGKSAMGDISTDPRLAQAQMNALDTMSKISGEGLTATDRMNLNTARRQVSGDEQSRQKSIMQQMAQRGAGGGGLELAARLASSQQSADQAGQQSDRTMAMAQQRMLEATMQSGQLGGQMRSQEFGEKGQQAQAADAIARFNAQNAAAAQSANVGAMNTAQARNLAERQRIADTGVATQNTQEQYNKNLLQQKFANDMMLAQSRANAAIGQGSQLSAAAGQTADMYKGIGAGVGQGLMGAAQLYGKPTADAPNTQATPTFSTGAVKKLPASGGFAETYDPSKMNAAEGGMVTRDGIVHGRSQNYAHGGEVLVPGDSIKNDKVDAKLSPGEVVIPRSIMNSSDPAGKAAEFIHSILVKTGRI